MRSRRRRRREPHSLDAPEWAGMPPCAIAPSLLLIDLGDEQSEWQVATASETNAVADPNSFLGEMLRSHCSLMSLPYWSSN